MSALTLVVATLAVWEALEIWRHSSIMAPWRARAEVLEGRSGELLRCPFCMAPYVGLMSWLALQCSWTFWVVWALAIARLANLANDLTHPWCRTPRHDRLLPGLPDQPSAQPATSAAGSELPPASQRTERFNEYHERDRDEEWLGD